MGFFSARDRGWDAQPTAPCEILLASDGRRAFTAHAVDEALVRAPHGLIAVVTVARIHGTAFGLPNPGLLPTRHELAERHAWVGHAVQVITDGGGQADGQVAVTRSVARTLARIARVRGARAIVIDETPHRGLRRFVEGDTGSDLTRLLRRERIEVVIIPPNPSGNLVNRL